MNNFNNNNINNNNNNNEEINKIKEEYEEFSSIKENLFKYFEEYNTKIIDCNTKIAKLREDYENESKKKYNQIEDRISKVENESKDVISIRNSTNKEMNNDIEMLKKRI